MPFLFLSYPFVLREGVKGIDISIGIGGSFLEACLNYSCLRMQSDPEASKCAVERQQRFLGKSLASILLMLLHSGTRLVADLVVGLLSFCGQKHGELHAES
uniref:Uncharacterized protein n=1 Tax=Populus trichocarpa TaxID=3694 RepID=A0A3N7EKX8_POPTR